MRSRIFGSAPRDDVEDPARGDPTAIGFTAPGVGPVWLVDRRSRAQAAGQAEGKRPSPGGRRGTPGDDNL